LNDNEKMKKESEFWSLMFLAIGAASFLAQLMQVHVVFKKEYFNSDISSPISSVLLIFSRLCIHEYHTHISALV